MINTAYLHTFKELLKTDLKLFKQALPNKIIDLCIWIVTWQLIYAYVLPSFGLEESYGAFTLASLIATSGLFEASPGITNIIADFEGDRIIDFYLTLPIPSWMVFLEEIAHRAIICATMSFFVLPLGQLLLWNSFSIMSIDFFRYTIIFILANLFYSVLILWTTSFVKTMTRIDSIWMRFIYPLWTLGCFQFSWESLYKLWPTLALINLLNPVTYVCEGMRSAILGPQHAINFWACVGMLILFCIAGTWDAISRLKRQLDFV